MPSLRDFPLRRSPRLQGYDYTQEGAYFVTICTHQRERLFGEIVGDKMHLNTFGQIVWEEWLQTAFVRPYVILDEFVIMPNHVHGILFIDDSVGTWRRHVPTCEPRVFGKPVAGSLSTIIGSFKSMVTRRINGIRNTPGASVWQGRFYDEIIRNEAMLNQIRQYILYNPAKWAEDHENPVNIRE